MKEKTMGKEYICELYNTGFWVNSRPQVCDDFQTDFRNYGYNASEGDL